MNTSLKRQGLGVFPRLRAAGVLNVLMLLAAAPCIEGQGLLDIGPSAIEDVDIPLHGSFSSSLGWDSDAGSRDGGMTNRGRGGGEGSDSLFWQNALSLGYGVQLDHRSNLGLSANYTNVYLFDPPPGVDEMEHNFDVGLRYSRQVTKRLSITDALYVSYEYEPNYDIGLSVTRPSGAYFLASNRLSAAYQWNHRLSTVSRYSFSTILYEDQSVENESYYRHQLSQDFRYAFKRRLSGVFTYRYTHTTYEDSDRAASSTHAVLAGADYDWSRRLSVSGMAGIDYRSYEDESEDPEVAPRVELSLRYILAKRTSLRWVNLVSLDDAGTAGLQSGYRYRSSLGLSHAFSRRLGGSLTFNYIHSDYGDSPDEFDGGSEDTFAGSVGLGYSLWRNVRLGANYSYSLITEDGVDDYRRHRAFVGVTVGF